MAPARENFVAAVATGLALIISRSTAGFLSGTRALQSRPGELEALNALDGGPADGERPKTDRLGYRPALDGVRALAIIAVLVPLRVAAERLLGVDVFFALSGFLITSLLLEEYAATGTITLRLFYARRALRLLPALLGFLIVWTTVFLATVPAEYGPLVLHE